MLHNREEFFFICFKISESLALVIIYEAEEKEGIYLDEHNKRFPLTIKEGNLTTQQHFLLNISQRK